MTGAFPVFLLDVDGVLLEPHGYRLAIQATLSYFTNQMGLGDLYPGEDAIAGLEAVNMTSEWDITPVMLASIFDGLMTANPGLTLPAGIEEACAVVRTLGIKPPRVDLPRLTARLGAAFRPGLVYADLALALNQPGAADPPFTGLVGHPLLANILANTRRVDGALTTRVFQHFSLGSDRFERIYGTAQIFPVESFLEKFDRRLLLPETGEQLLSACRSGKIGAAVYTARPSAPHLDGKPLEMGSPEAELAMEVLALDSLPLIGAGEMNWLAARAACRVDELIKPSPAQALAAIGAAVTGSKEYALEGAAGLFLKGAHPFYRNMPPLSIHIFEDSGGNIRAVRRAGEILARAGASNQVSAWGIAANLAKRQALESAGAMLMADINTALREALSQEAIS